MTYETSLGEMILKKFYKFVIFDYTNHIGDEFHDETILIKDDAIVAISQNIEPIKIY